MQDKRNISLHAVDSKLDTQPDRCRLITFALHALPLLVLVGLLASGRTGPVPACLVALACSLPVAWIASGGDLAGFAVAQTVRGAWLAFPAMAIVSGGLLFHTATERPSSQVASEGGSQMFTAAFLLGPFAESVTGFGVGSIFAIGAMQRAGAAGAPAAAMGLLALCLIPWGGLGPGSALGAALAEVPAQPMLARNAAQAAAFMLGLLPLFWHWAALSGHAVPARERLGQCGWVAAAGGLLLLWLHLLPWELAGMLATGPLLVARLLLTAPLRGAAAWRRALLAALPYAMLVGAILLTRLWTSPPAWQPLPGLPPLPLTHVAAVIWLVALLLLLLRRISPLASLRRARRPMLAILSFVVLSRWLFAAGTPAVLAGGLESLLGPFARYGTPLLALMSGFVGGSNVASNAMMMPLQAALGRLQGLPATLLPAVQNFTGAQASMFSPQVVGVFGGLAGVTPGPVWRLAWPVFVLLLVIGLATVALG